MRRTAGIRLARLWRGWFRPLLVAVIVVTTFRSAIADWNDVPTGSMTPSILAGDRIFVNRLAYDLRVPFTAWRIAEWARPARGDVVVFTCPADGKRMVKRVIGLPGETIELRDNVLWIDGRAVEYTPAGEPAPTGRTAMTERLPGRRHTVLFSPAHRAMRSFGPVRVPRDHYFLMGDNRDNSRDSRYFGPVPAAQIVGRASTVVFSLDLDGAYLPRPERFLRSIP